MSKLLHNALRKPKLQAPPRTTDTHLHIFGPLDRYPYSESREFTPDEKLPSDYELLCEVLGIERAVLVQPSIYGFDNRCQLDSLPLLGIPARAIVVVEPSVAESELVKMHEAGARGVRFNNGRRGGIPLNDLERFADRIAAMNWHIQMVVGSSAELIELESRLMRLPCDLVIDHIGLVQAACGVMQPAFQSLLRLLAGGRCWVKLSGFYQLSTQPSPYHDVRPLVESLVAARPDRLVWGSDWPHPFFRNCDEVDSVDLFNALAEWIPNPAARQQVLADNAGVLYGF